MTAAWIPAELSGRVTRQKACKGVAPRSSAASSVDGPSFSREEYSVRMANGMNR
jgi:hypothetical protein